MNELTPLDAGGQVLVHLEKAQEYIRASRSKGTQQLYAHHWRAFEGWCVETGVPALPAAPEAIAAYASAVISEIKPATLQLRLAAISVRHQGAGLPSPTRTELVRSVMKGIRREHGTAQVRKAALVTEDIRAMIANLPGTDIKRARDRALLLIGFAGGFRRSELIGMDAAHLAFELQGLRITLPRSKTDQEGKGREIGITGGRHRETCPVQAVRQWLDGAEIDSGPVFRPINRHGAVGSTRLSSVAVGLIIKGAAQAVGLDPTRFSGHSLRAGHVTAAAHGGAPVTSIKDQTGHRSDAMVQRYVRRATLFDANSSAYLGL